MPSFSALRDVASVGSCADAGQAHELVHAGKTSRGVALCKSFQCLRVSANQAPILF
jgi:hypothetical protein